MRITQHNVAAPSGDHPRGIAAHIRSADHNRDEPTTTALLLATVAVVAYLVGILYEKQFAPGLFTEIALYYLNDKSYSAYLNTFLRMQVAAFFQLTLVLFLGFHLLGSMLSVLFCALQGLFFGICMASIASRGGKMLIWFWLINGAFILCHAVNTLWLGNMAKRSGDYLFCKTLNRNLPQSSGHAPYRLKYLIIRYILSLAFSLLYSAVGALIAILFAGVLL